MEVIDGVRIASPTTCKRYVGKNVIVTAGTLGIGRAIAHRFLQEGAKVVICSRKESNVKETVKQFADVFGANNIFGFPCNLGDTNDLVKFVNDALQVLDNRVDVVVSNVGINPVAGKALDLDINIYDKIMNTNVRSHWLLIKHTKPYITKNSGSIILISSVGGFSPSFPTGIYAMSKTALIGLGRALADELAVDGIRINTVCPGVVKTKMAELLWKNERNADKTANRVSLKRHGEPVEIAGIVAYLGSEEASFTTGETFVLSGGTQTRL